ncbi:MAG: hypothetical protein WDN26_09325 [Chitinophagaceae bacterium]
MKEKILGLLFMLFLFSDSKSQDTILTSAKDTIANDEGPIQKEPSLDLLAKKGNRVFVDGSDKSVIIHAKKEFHSWGYWSIVEDKSKADFILYVNIRYAGIGDSFGSAQFIDPQSEKVIQTTGEVNTVMSMGFNTKKAAVEKVVRKKIKPLFR